METIKLRGSSQSRSFWRYNPNVACSRNHSGSHFNKNGIH
jgi:hypothetical protein